MVRALDPMCSESRLFHGNLAALAEPLLHTDKMFTL